MSTVQNDPLCSGSAVSDGAREGCNREFVSGSIQNSDLCESGGDLKSGIVSACIPPKMALDAGFSRNASATDSLKNPLELIGGTNGCGTNVTDCAENTKTPCYALDSIGNAGGGGFDSNCTYGSALQIVADRPSSGTCASGNGPGADGAAVARFVSDLSFYLAYADAADLAASCALHREPLRELVRFAKHALACDAVPDCPRCGEGDAR